MYSCAYTRARTHTSTHTQTHTHKHTHTHTNTPSVGWKSEVHVDILFTFVFPFFCTPPNNAVSCIPFWRGLVGCVCVCTMRACVCVCVRVCACVCASMSTTSFGNINIWNKQTATRIHAFTEKDYILRNEFNNIPSSSPSTVPIPSLPPFFIRVRDRILPRAIKNIVPAFFSLSSHPMHLAPGLLHPDDAYGQLIEERHCILFFFECFINAYGYRSKIPIWCFELYTQPDDAVQGVWRMCARWCRRMAHV